MSRRARLAAYAFVLVVMFAGGTVVGGSVGPDPAHESPATPTVHEGESNDPNHDRGH